MRFEIHVRPNASSTAVGGVHDNVLAVRVREPADQGRATAAALRAVADALAVPARSVSLVRGASTRRKLIDVAVPAPEEAALTARLGRLRGERGS